MILSCPVYIYGLYLAREPDMYDVLPPIVFNGVYLMLTPQFFKSYSIIHRLSDRMGILIGVLIAGAGITFNGLVLSSSDPYYLIGTFFYGGFGGNLRSITYNMTVLFTTTATVTTNDSLLI